MPDSNLNRLKKIVDEKHMQKEPDHHSKPSRKVGATHKQYSSIKHSGSNNRV